MALLDFMKRYHPEDIENLNMISVGFGMYREAAEHLQKQGLAEIERIKPYIKSLYTCNLCYFVLVAF